MKTSKILIVVFFVVLMVSFCACSRSQESATNSSESINSGEIEEDLSESSTSKSDETNDAEGSHNTNGSEEDVLDVTNNKNKFFLTSKEAQIGEEITLTLSLIGEVSICRYSIQIEYDNVVLQLKTYDEELSVFSPIVYPQKDVNGKITDNTSGIIRLEWANANNITKEGKIAEFVFRVCDIAVAKTEVRITVNGANCISNSTVVEAEYSVKNAIITIQ